MYASKCLHVAKRKQPPSSTSPRTVSQKLRACVCENKPEYPEASLPRRNAG